MSFGRMNATNMREASRRSHGAALVAAVGFLAALHGCASDELLVKVDSRHNAVAFNKKMLKESS